jgi:hypothetical protein
MRIVDLPERPASPSRAGIVLSRESVKPATTRLPDSTETTIGDVSERGPAQAQAWRLSVSFRNARASAACGPGIGSVIVDRLPGVTGLAPQNIDGVIYLICRTPNS